MKKPYYQDEWVTQYCGDALKVLSGLEGDSIDLLATDPPYGIGFMGKDWDKALPDKQIWAECLRVLKAGSFAFVMSIPRADCLSRMIISLEDAGFNVGFSPIYWAYASGFPKAQNIGKAVDKRLGVPIEKHPAINMQQGSEVGEISPNKRCAICGLPFQSANPCKCDRSYKTITPQAKALAGSYGGFQPKPAVEVIIVAMKPLSEKTFVDQALKNGKGITWLDDCRIPYEGNDDNKECNRGNKRPIGDNYSKETAFKIECENRENKTAQGRFPANLLVSDDVLNVESRGAFAPVKSGQKPWGGEIYGKFASGGDDGKSFYGDSGSFSRYFDLDKWAQKTFPFLIVPKASKSEKNKGLGEHNKKQPIDFDSQTRTNKETADKYGAERKSQAQNYHPTVKPLKLMSYLITLGSRAGDMVLDPFLGSGTTALACELLNRKCIGIEIEEKYCEIAAKRCSQSVMRLDI